VTQSFAPPLGAAVHSPPESPSSFGEKPWQNQWILHPSRPNKVSIKG